MSELPPKKVKVLTRLRIDEVSAVDSGAGKGVKVMLMKRGPDAADNYTELSLEERAKAKMIGRTALRDQEDIARRAKQDREDGDVVRNTYRDIFLGKLTAAQALGLEDNEAGETRKTYAADARGDEADDQDEATPVDEMADGATPPPPDGASDGVPAKHRPISFDVGSNQTITARN